MSGAMHLQWDDSLVHCIFSALYLWYDASLVSCIIGVMHPCSNASFAGCIFGVMSLWWAAYMMQCIYGVLNLWCAASLLRCSFGVMSLLWFIYLLQYSFRCIASLVLCICTFGMLFIGIFGVPNRWCAATLVNYILVAIFLWCNVCIFGELHLWWIIFWLQYFFGVMYLRCIASLVLCICTFGMLCIGNFVGASLVWLLLCNASLVHCFLVLGAIIFWCCVFGAMHCQLYRAVLLPQWRIYFIIYILYQDILMAMKPNCSGMIQVTFSGPDKNKKKTTCAETWACLLITCDVF